MEFVEVEAHTSGETVKEGLLLVVGEALGLIDEESELDDLLSLELVLHEGPVGDSTIRGDGVEVQISNILVGVPSDLPDGISVLVGSNSGKIDWLIMTLKSDIEDHDSTIIETNSQKGGVVGMEVQAHDTRLSGEVVLRPSGVLDGVAADETSRLLMEGVVTVSNGEEIPVLGVPLD